MTPENGLLEEEIPLGNPHFQVQVGGFNRFEKH